MNAAGRGIRRPKWIVVLVLLATGALGTEDPPARRDWRKPYSPPCVECENVFAFTEKPSVKLGRMRFVEYEPGKKTVQAPIRSN